MNNISHNSRVISNIIYKNKNDAVVVNKNWQTKKS